MNNYLKILDILDKLSLDALLISSPYNIRYISGFTGATGYVYISKSSKIIFTDFRYTIQAEKEADGYEVITITNKGYGYFLNKVIKQENIKNLGFESEDMLHSTYLNLLDKLEIKNFTPIKDEITRLRRIKTKIELENIKKAQAIADKTFSDILSFIKTGKTEIQIAAKIEYLLKTNGAEGTSFSTIVASGINSSMPHAGISDKKIEKGDLITLDFGCLYKGYCSDMTRTIVVGKASPKQKEIYNLVLKGQMAALEFIKAGVKGKEVDKIARDIIYGAGYEGCFGHGLGHSLGLFIHENPRLSALEEDVLEARMVATVEPGIYIKGFGGVRIEDLVEVTNDGCENYTKSTKDLIEL